MAARDDYRGCINKLLRWECQSGWSPLRWCLFVVPLHGYADQPIVIEAVLATEDALAPGNYSARFRILGRLCQRGCVRNSLGLGH